MSKLLSAVALSVLGLSAFGTFHMGAAQATATPSHCLPYEERVFSCQIQKSNKVVSLCAVPKQNQQAGYLQYRFGRPGHVELAFPPKKAHSYPQFRWQTIGYSGGWETRIQFVNGGYTYQVYDRAYKIDMQHKDRSGGIFVLKGQKQVAHLQCQASSFGPDPYAWGLNDLYDRVPQGNFF